MTTLTVTVGDDERIERDTVRRIRAAEAGVDLADDQPLLIFEDYATLSRFFTAANLDLLDEIVRAEPASIRETARLVDRDYREVHRNLSELESLGVVRFEGGGQGTAKKPIVPYDAIEVTLSLGSEAAARSSASP